MSNILTVDIVEPLGYEHILLDQPYSQHQNPFRDMGSKFTFQLGGDVRFGQLGEHACWLVDQVQRERWSLVGMSPDTLGRLLKLLEIENNFFRDYESYRQGNSEKPEGTKFTEEDMKLLRDYYNSIQEFFKQYYTNKHLTHFRNLSPEMIASILKTRERLHLIQDNMMNNDRSGTLAVVSYPILVTEDKAQGVTTLTLGSVAKVLNFTDLYDFNSWKSSLENPS